MNAAKPAINAATTPSGLCAEAAPVRMVCVGLGGITLPTEVGFWEAENPPLGLEMGGGITSVPEGLIGEMGGGIIPVLIGGGMGMIVFVVGRG